MKIKICGLFRLEDIGFVNEALPDYIGFVFADSRRRVSKELAVSMKKKLDSRIQSVGVFVDPDMKEVESLAREGIIDLIQLHGSESASFIRELKERTGATVIKALRVESEEDIRRGQELQADYLLLDNGSGGTGSSFDWSLIPEIGTPFFLAGGIHPGNIGEAMKAGRPFALDVSSGAEAEGIKDRDKIMELVRRVRNG